jgi:PAS domain S-box-containing protein
MELGWPHCFIFIIVLISIASYSAQTRASRVQRKNNRIETQTKAENAIETTVDIIQSNTQQVASFYNKDLEIFESNAKIYLQNKKYKDNVKSVAFMSYVPINNETQDAQTTIAFTQPRDETQSQSRNTDELVGADLSSITDLSSEITLVEKSGERTISQPFVNNALVENQSVFVALVYPVFEKELNASGLTEKRFQGVLVVPIALDIFLDSSQKRSQSFKIMRITVPWQHVANGNRFFESSVTQFDSTVVSVGDRNFRVEYDVAARDTSESSLARKSTLGTGLGLAVIVFLLFSIMRLNERRAHRLTEQAEREIYASEARFSALIQQSSDITLVIDSKGYITFASPSVESKIGIAVQDILGKNIGDIVGVAETARKTISVIKSLNRGQTVEPFEAEVLASNGKIHTFECVINDLRNDDAVQRNSL